MNIGILTFHRCINNGAVMQSYSLSKRLREELSDDNVEIIDYNMPCVDECYKPSLINVMKGGNIVIKAKKLYRLAKNPQIFQQDKKRIEIFQETFETLPLSQKKIYSNGTEELFQYINSTYDIVIAGSDAIWNYDLRGFPNPYFLDDTIKCEKFAYAASVYGMNYEKIPDDQKKKISEIFSTYNLICTRDDESEKFVHELNEGLMTIHTCDPTVFLDVNSLPITEDGIRRKLKDRGFQFDKEAIGMMGSNAMCEMIRRMYGDKYQIVALFSYSPGADVNLYDFTPYEWAYVFRYFKLTFTTYFHGTLLSLRNGTPVICISLVNDYSKVHMTKVEDFLLRIGLEDCFFSTDYRTQNIGKIKEKANYLLSHDLKGEIISKMDKEAETFQPFLAHLKKTKEIMGERK